MCNLLGNLSSLMVAITHDPEPRGSARLEERCVRVRLGQWFGCGCAWCVQAHGCVCCAYILRCGVPIFHPVPLALRGIVKPNGKKNPPPERSEVEEEVISNKGFVYGARTQIRICLLWDVRYFWDFLSVSHGRARCTNHYAAHRSH